MIFKCWERNVCAEQKLAPCSLFRFRFSSLFNHCFIVLQLFLPRSWHVQNSWKYFSYVLLVVDVTNIVAQNWLFLCFKKCNYSNSNNNNSNNNSNNNNNNNNNIIIIIIIKKIFTNNEWMMSGSWIKFDEGLMTMDKFSNANGSNSLSRICLLWRDPCRGAVQYLPSLLD